MKLDDKTTIPLWSVIVSVPVVVGFISWISFIAYASTQNTKDIDQLMKSKDTHYKLLMDIKTDVAIIKERVEHKNK